MDDVLIWTRIWLLNDGRHSTSEQNGGFWFKVNLLFCFFNFFFFSVYLIDRNPALLNNLAGLKPWSSSHSPSSPPSFSPSLSLSFFFLIFIVFLGFRTVRQDERQDDGKISSLGDGKTIKYDKRRQAKDIRGSSLVVVIDVGNGAEYDQSEHPTWNPQHLISVYRSNFFYNRKFTNREANISSKPSLVSIKSDGGKRFDRTTNEYSFDWNRAIEKSHQDSHYMSSAHWHTHKIQEWVKWKRRITKLSKQDFSCLD